MLGLFIIFISLFFSCCFQYLKIYCAPDPSWSCSSVFSSQSVLLCFIVRFVSWVVQLPVQGCPCLSHRVEQKQCWHSAVTETKPKRAEAHRTARWIIQHESWQGGAVEGGYHPLLKANHHKNRFWLCLCVFISKIFYITDFNETFTNQSLFVQSVLCVSVCIHTYRSTVLHAGGSWKLTSRQHREQLITALSPPTIRKQ